MTPYSPVTRIDTLDQTLLIRKKLGKRRADKYFQHLKKWFSALITKADFDTLLMKTMGSENIPLHNRLIKSIAYNSCAKNGRRPPPARKEKPPVPQSKPPKIISIESDPPPLEGASGEEGEEVEQGRLILRTQSKRKVIPLLLGPRRAPISICKKSGEVPDTKTLRNCLKENLGVEDLKLTVDCANVVNNAVDSYLKSIIRPCVVSAMKRKRSDSYSVSMKDFRFGFQANQLISRKGCPFICTSQQ